MKSFIVPLFFGEQPTVTEMHGEAARHLIRKPAAQVFRWPHRNSLQQSLHV